MKHACLAAAVIATGLSTSAYAQSVPANIGVADRQRPAYDPIGGRIGTFILYPSLESSVAYDDNIFATETGKVSDTIFTVSPKLRLASQWLRHKLELSAQLTRNFYVKNSNEDTTNTTLNANGTIDVNRQTQVRLLGNIGRLTEARTDINSIEGISAPTRYTTKVARATVDNQAGLFSFTLDGGVQRLTFNQNHADDGSLVDQSFRNDTQRDISLKIRYRMPSGTAVYLRLSGDQLRYDSKTITINGVTTPFDRNSDGYRAEVGLSVELSSLLYGDVRVGYLHRNEADPTIRDVSGVSFGADLLWNITPLTTIRLVADRTVEDSSSQTIAGNLRSQGTLTVDHELLRNLLLNASVRYADISPIGPLSNSQEVEFNAGARYLMSRRVVLQAHYQYYRRISQVYQEFIDNRFTLTATIRL
jgi:hypothetical protein